MSATVNLAARLAGVARSKFEGSGNGVICCSATHQRYLDEALLQRRCSSRYEHTNSSLNISVSFSPGIPVAIKGVLRAVEVFVVNPALDPVSSDTISADPPPVLGAALVGREKEMQRVSHDQHIQNVSCLVCQCRFNIKLANIKLQTFLPL